MAWNGQSNRKASRVCHTRISIYAQPKAPDQFFNEMIAIADLCSGTFTGSLFAYKYTLMHSSMTFRGVIQKLDEGAGVGVTRRWWMLVHQLSTQDHGILTPSQIIPFLYGASDSRLIRRMHPSLCPMA